MTWKTRICGENLYHHVYAWGNDRHPVFKEIYHYRKYLKLLKTLASQQQIEIIAYALMEWHVHLFIFDRNNAISSFMQDLHGDYAQYFNKDAHRVGHVFGERFNNKIVQANEYGLWLSRYVHRQPLEAGLVDDPKDYAWTSYRKYLGVEENDFLEKDVIMQQFGSGKAAIDRYEKFVMNDDDGPVNWADKKINIAMEIEIINKAIAEFGLSRRVLIAPQGATERIKRQMVIIEMHKKYGYKIRPLARAFKMSHATISEILRGHKVNGTD